MKTYCYKELRTKTLNELLDLLSSYIFLKEDIEDIITKDPESTEFYVNEHLFHYELNIRKIKNELEVRVK